MDSSFAAQIRQALAQRDTQIQTLKSQIDAVMRSRVAPDAWIDEIPGKRVSYWLQGSQSFLAAQDGTRGNPVNMLVNQDGPFVATHLPIVAWKPNAPSTATNLGRWSAIFHGPQPTLNGSNIDIISISWELIDAGSNRNFQNGTIPPFLNTLGMGDQLKKLPVRTYFAPNSTVQFVPTYEEISFNGSAGVPTTGGLLVIVIPGYRILAI